MGPERQSTPANTPGSQCAKSRVGAVGPSSPLLLGQHGMMSSTSPGGNCLSLKITLRKENDRAILELTGSLTQSPTLQTVRETVRQILHTNQVAEILLDLAG